MRETTPESLPKTVSPAVVPSVRVPWPTERVTVRLALSTSPTLMPLIALSTSSKAVWAAGTATVGASLTLVTLMVKNVSVERPPASVERTRIE